MATDIEQLVTEALTAILEADSGIRALTGRTTRNCVPFLTGSASEKLPILLLAPITITPIGGLGDTRRARYQVSAVHKGDGARAMTNALLERVELAVTQPALETAGLDAYVERTDRRRFNGDDGLERADIDLTLIVRKS